MGMLLRDLEDGRQRHRVGDLHHDLALEEARLAERRHAREMLLVVAGTRSNPRGGPGLAGPALLL